MRIFLQEPGIGPKLVLLALRSFCEGGSEACPELAVALPALRSFSEGGSAAEETNLKSLISNPLKNPCANPRILTIELSVLIRNTILYLLVFCACFLL